ncbi:MAG: hypothetical protein MJB57_00175 [Gemmatimonadetes bacterium]|nr:hypothetical protein [Gemmatimonadota bacterium]
MCEPLRPSPGRWTAEPSAGGPAAALVLSGLAFGACIDTEGPSGVTQPGPGNQTALSFNGAFAGHAHGCAIVNGGAALCWGAGGDLGDGTLDESATPVRVQGPQIFAQLDLSSFTCGLTTGIDGGQAWCWGENTSGRLGDGTTEDGLVPQSVDTELAFEDIATAGVHACAISTEDDLYCWGSNSFSQLLAHPDTFSVSPIPVATGMKFRDVDGGGLQTCAIDDGESLWCWGGNWGDSMVEVTAAPIFERLSVGGEHACGLTTDGEAFCFGSNTEGQLGDGTFDQDPLGSAPVPVATELRFIDISAGSFHTCAIADDGVAYCWGRDALGQLGDGNPAGEPGKKNTPTQVVTSTTFVDFVDISAGRFTSCGVTNRQVGLCWGFGTGSASQSFSFQPVEIGS